MPFFLRRVEPGRESYRVILKDEDGETELGSIGPQHTVGAETRWVWGIDTVIPLREADQTGYGDGRKDCMTRFQSAWNKLAADPAASVSKDTKSEFPESAAGAPAFCVAEMAHEKTRSRFLPV